MTIHLGFDMGIRNLAYCLIQHDISGVRKVLAWDNIDLLEGGISSQDSKSCYGCGVKAIWCDESNKWCNACASGVRRKKSVLHKPSLPLLTCATNVKELRPLAISRGWEHARTAKKTDLLDWAKGHYLMPWTPVKAKDTSLETIFHAMNTWLNSVLPTFKTATLIRLENQPVMKGPTMKSVQIMLYTLLNYRLRHEYGWNGRIEFVHAGTKSKNNAINVDVSGVSESEAYRNRKKTAETDVIELLTKAEHTTWLTFFNSRTKKSDLADSFLMAYRL